MAFKMPFAKDSAAAISDLLERGVHFGHKTARWNPKMKPYIYRAYNGVHIIDLTQTLVKLEKALNAVYQCVREGGRVLFVGTKLQARRAIQEAATRCGQYYVNHRWLGGTLTNWSTISASIRKLRTLEETMSSDAFQSYTKKEKLGFYRELDKYNRALGGIRNMGGLPDMVFVIDVNKEVIAVKESNDLGIPVVGIVDTNTNPDNITYAIPGNDDSLKAIAFYCDMMARACIMGLEEEFSEEKVKKGPKDNPKDALKGRSGHGAEINETLAEKGVSEDAAENTTELGAELGAQSASHHQSQSSNQSHGPATLTKDEKRDFRKDEKDVKQSAPAPKAVR